MRMAEKCLQFMARAREDDIDDEWQDIFLRYQGASSAPWLVDFAATDQADPEGMSDVVVFLDGSRLVWDEAQNEWRVG